MPHASASRTSGGTSGSAVTAADGQAGGEILPGRRRAVEGVDARGRADNVVLSNVADLDRAGDGSDHPSNHETKRACGGAEKSRTAKVNNACTACPDARSRPRQGSTATHSTTWSAT